MRRASGRSSSQARKVELAKIHIAANQLGLIRGADKDAYKDMLWAVARVRSAADLDEAGRKKVLAHLRAVGFKDTSPPRPHRTTPQAEKIRAMWKALAAAGQVRDASERALRVYVQHQSASYDPNQHGYSAPELLPSPVAQRVIEHLKQWCRRTGTET